MGRHNVRRSLLPEKTREKWPRGARLLPLSHIVSIMDNLNIKGIRDDEPHARGKARPRGKVRKLFVLESRIERHVSDGLAKTLGLWDWWVHSRYTTRARRDQAHAALVKKVPSQPAYWKLEYRTRDD